jgi:hypothetical protein
MVEVAQRLPQSLQEFMDKAEEFINQKETLRAILGPDPSQISTFEMPKKKKKVNREESSTAFKPTKRFKDYNFTPLNASITEVLMEVKKDPAYEKLRKIFGKPMARTVNRYCAFHKTNGHNTKTFISLRVLIEKFIENGKLVRFLTD